MTRVFHRAPLEATATFWRIDRRDGVTLGLTSHDRDLWLGGVLHRAAPGMLPSAIRRSAGFAPDSAEVQGALTHDSLSAADLAAGRFDGAAVAIGIADWETREHAVLYRGEIGALAEQAGRFTAELRSAKAELEADLVPRTGPTCRAAFCGPGCTLSAARFTHEAMLETVDPAASRVTFTGGPAFAAMREGSLRWIDGPHAGQRMEVHAADTAGLVLGEALGPMLLPGTRALLREGCDHRLETCHARFGNSANFQGEPFLPGNDLVARYPAGPG